MAQTLSHVTLLVRDYDEAISFFTNALGFQLIEDTPQDQGKRCGSSSPPPALTAAACFSPRHQRPNKPRALATRPAAAYFSSCTPTISCATIVE